MVIKMKIARGFSYKDTINKLAELIGSGCSDADNADSARAKFYTAAGKIESALFDDFITPCDRMYMLELVAALEKLFETELTISEYKIISGTDVLVSLNSELCGKLKNILPRFPDGMKKMIPEREKYLYISKMRRRISAVLALYESPHYKSSGYASNRRNFRERGEALPCALLCVSLCTLLCEGLSELYELCVVSQKIILSV